MLKKIFNKFFPSNCSCGKKEITLGNVRGYEKTYHCCNNDMCEDFKKIFYISKKGDKIFINAKFHNFSEGKLEMLILVPRKGTEDTYELEKVYME